MRKLKVASFAPALCCHKVTSVGSTFSLMAAVAGVGEGVESRDRAKMASSRDYNTERKLGAELILSAVRQLKRLGKLGPTFLGELGRFALPFAGRPSVAAPRCFSGCCS